MKAESLKFYFRNTPDGGVTVTPAKDLNRIIIDIFANILGLIYQIAVGIAHSYAWYVVFLQNLFLLSSPSYIFIAVSVGMAVYYLASYYTDPYFWDNNSNKLQNVLLAIKKQASDLYNKRHITVLASLVIPSCSITLILYCMLNAANPASPADIWLYLFQPILVCFAIIAAIVLLYLAFKPLSEQQEIREKALNTSALKTNSYILICMLFYIACGVMLGVVANFFFNPILNYHLCQLGSLTSWIIAMSACAAFPSASLILYRHNEDFRKEAAEFFDATYKSRLFSTLFRTAKDAITGTVLAIAIFSLMFAPMIHIVPNIWPHVFSILSQTSFGVAISQVCYTSALVSTVLSLFNSAFSIDKVEKQTGEARFDYFFPGARGETVTVEFQSSSSTSKEEDNTTKKSQKTESSDGKNPAATGKRVEQL